jgi:hypothetical protein
MVKSLYGLKQFPRALYIKIAQQLGDNGFIRLLSNPNLYVKRKGDDVILLLYI